MRDLCVNDTLPANYGSIMIAMQECNDRCADFASVPSCYTDCFADAHEISKDCAGCYFNWYFGSALGCKWCDPNPLASGIDPGTAAECQSCYAAQEEAFVACAGVTQSASPWKPNNACKDPAEAAIVQQKDLAKVSADCKISTDCIETATGLGAACSSCYVGWFQCAHLGACINDCFSSPVTDEPCKSCANQKCLPLLKACTGLSSPW